MEKFKFNYRQVVVDIVDMEPVVKSDDVKPFVSDINIQELVSQYAVVNRRNKINKLIEALNVE